MIGLKTNVETRRLFEGYIQDWKSCFWSQWSGSVEFLSSKPFLTTSMHHMCNVLAAESATVAAPCAGEVVAIVICVPCCDLWPSVIWLDMATNLSTQSNTICQALCGKPLESHIR